MGRIVCIGSMNMDIAAYAAALPRPGETVLGDSMTSSPGGKGLNQAIAARRLGSEVAIVGCLGEDTNGDSLAAFLTSEGVDAERVVRVAAVATGAAIILVDRSSQNSIVVIPGANMAWPDGAVDRLDFAAGDVVMAQFEVPQAVIVAAFERARMARAVTLLNAAPARDIPAALLRLIDVLVVNETELAAACGLAIDESDRTAIERAAKGLARDGRAVIVTLGRAGALLAHDGDVEVVDGTSVAAIDTAGAGDCFVGALAAALSRGEDLHRAAVYANRAASISVTRRGTAVSMPYADEL